MPHRHSLTPSSLQSYPLRFDSGHSRWDHPTTPDKGHYHARREPGGQWDGARRVGGRGALLSVTDSKMSYIWELSEGGGDGGTGKDWHTGKFNCPYLFLGRCGQKFITFQPGCWEVQFPIVESTIRGAGGASRGIGGCSVGRDEVEEVAAL